MSPCLRFSLLSSSPGPQEEVVINVSTNTPSGKECSQEPLQEPYQEEPQHVPSMVSKVYQAASGLVVKVEKAAGGEKGGE